MAIAIGLDPQIRLRPVNSMQNKTETVTNVPSWYPTMDELIRKQRGQLEKSKQEALAFASKKFGRNTRPWWRRLVGIG